MSIRSGPDAWGSLAKLFHWGIATLVIANLTLGLWMVELESSAQKMRSYGLHKSIGISVLGLMLLRLLWRAFDRRPSPPPGMSPLARRLSRALHAGFYLLLLALPLSGWLYNSAANFPLRWFGFVSLPRLTAADPALKQLAHSAHEWLAYLVIAAVLVHVSAALKHHLLDRDQVLRRMLPFARTDRSPPPGDAA